MDNSIIEAGSSSQEPDQDRSMDSKKQFDRFSQECRQQNNQTTVVDGNTLCSTFEYLDIQTKKKVRRSPRVKEKLAKVANEQIAKVNRTPNESTVLDYKIRAMHNETKSKVCRIKNDGCKHMNRRFYLNLIKINASAKDVKVDNDSKSNKFVSKISNGIVSEQTNTSLNTLNLQSVNCSFSSTSLKLKSHGKIHGSKNSGKKKERASKRRFPEYWSAEKIEEGLQTGQVIKGALRINAKKFTDSYVSNEDGAQHDYIIQSIVERNRALEGDIVAICIKPQSEWTEKLKTATVVNIVEKVHPRTGVGFLKPSLESKQFANFVPRDLRLPRMLIRLETCPSGFSTHPSRFENMLFKAKLTAWNQVKAPIGILLENIGPAGDLESETAALLAENCLDTTPFCAEALADMSLTENIPEELSYREDLRKECVFTIDPSTARDLDDAVSCKELPNGNLEVGVHISDVTYYLKDASLLDKLVCKKGTTIYLVNNVYHMLPRDLCMHCSLLPGLDKLAFSVFWEMTKSGEILSHRFARTVINSCAQLAYEHAQTMIETPNHNFRSNELPQIYGNFTYQDLSKTVNYLAPIARKFREKRFANGTLRIDQIKLLFKLDPNTGDPSEMFVYKNMEAHRLIEEFMLLANNYVAQRIHQSHPNLAFLRSHCPPNHNMLLELVKMLQPFDIQLDVSSSKSIQETLSTLQNKLDEGKMLALYHLIAKPMKRANYFCAANTTGEQDFHHYALNTPMYTHFTSPIRRYADIMVHRLLAASLGYDEVPKWTQNWVTYVANNCNAQKQSAKLAGEASSDLYLAHYVEENQPFTRNAVVIDVKNSFFDILVVATGTVVRIHPNKLDDGLECREDVSDTSKKKYLIVFPETSTLSTAILTVELFSRLTVSLHRKPKTNKLEARLLRPIQTLEIVRR